MDQALRIDCQNRTKGNDKIDQCHQDDRTIDGPGNVALGIIHIFDGIDHKLEALISDKRDRRDDQDIDGRDRPEVFCKLFGKEVQIGFAEVDQCGRDDQKNEKFDIDHHIFDPSHSFDTPEIDQRKDPDDRDGDQFSDHLIVGKSKTTDTIGGEGIGIECQCADVAKDRIPADKGGCHMGVGIGSFIESVGGPLVFVVDPKLHIGVGGEPCHKPAQCDCERSQGAHNGDRDT